VDLPEKISVNPRLDTTLAQQLTQQFTWFIASGQLQPGELLPSVRELARQLGINLHTVRSAYQKLEADGLVKTRQGLGTKVLPYNPRRMAQIARATRSHTVGIIVPSITNPFYHLLLQGVEIIANQSQTMLFVCVTHDDPDEARRYYAQLAAKNVDGVLLASQDDSLFITSEAKSGEPGSHPLPLVAVDWPASSGYSVALDLENAGYQATWHLLEHGHRRVGLLTFALNLPNVHPVNQGYQRALGEANIALDPRWVAAVHGFDIQAGAEGARRLLALEQPPTAIFAISDLLAIGAMCAVQQAGLQVPQEMAIAGFNDITLAAVVNPPLTTVVAPACQMGEEAMKMLLSLIAGKRPGQREIVLPTSLIIRQSCGAHDQLNPCQEAPVANH
jgi:DNA-binding LacI/PurR family transcriptional regulator